MRPFAAVALLALSGCPGPSPIAQPIVAVSFIASNGSQQSATSGMPLRLRNLPVSCAPTDTLEFQNFGQATARFELSEPSANFTYERGPFELPVGGRLSVPVLIDPSRDLPGDGRLRHEFRLDPVDREFMEPQFFTLAASVITPELVPSFDFGAVVIGESARRSWDRNAVLSGDFMSLNDAVVFSPSRVGLHTETVNWIDRPECAQLRVTLLGNGVTSRVANVPGPIEFGPVPIGTTAERELVVTAWTNDLARFATTSTAFAVDPAPATSTPAERDPQLGLQPARHVVKVRFTPSATVLYRGMVELRLANTITAITVSGSGNP